MKALVLGATGAIGRRVSAELAQAPDVEQLIVSGRDGRKAERLASLLGGRTSPRVLDLSDPGALTASARDVDVVVCAAGPHYLFEVDVVRAVIDAETNYVSLCDDQSVAARVLAMNDAARDAGVAVVSGCGLSPGLTNLLVAIGADEIDEVEEIEIAVAASSADTPGDATTLHFLTQMTEPAEAISDHEAERGRAGTSPRLVYFPDPVGWVETFRSGHPEITTLPRTHPGLRSLRFRIGLTERAAMDLVRASATTGVLGSDKKRRLWMRLSEPLRPAIELLPPRGAPWTAARVDVRGRAEGRTRTVSLGVVDHLSNLAAVPLAHAARELGAGRTKNGVLVPDAAFDSRRFLQTVAERGIRIARLDPAPV